MNNIVKIKTLSPVHKGSGTILQYNTDFVTVENKRTGDRYLQVLDDKKILKLIGVENIPKWILSIERNEDTKAFVKRMAPDSKIADYNKRRMMCFTNNVTNETLKEHIHNGLGLPYIPGSSIKGAIRTAVFASMADSIRNMEEKIFKSSKPKASMVEKALFGDDPTADCFRFIHVGDSYFAPGCEIALRLVMYLNVTQNTDLHPHKDLKPQLAEAIGADEESSFRLNICKEYAQWVARHSPTAHVLPPEINNLASLFELINTHTRKLVEEEITVWENLSENHNGAEEYIGNMKEILKEIEACHNGKACILRLGHTSGWRFITGAWSEKKPYFNKIKDAARPANYRYRDYGFPKSRRTDSDGCLLGFVKLSV